MLYTLQDEAGAVYEVAYHPDNFFQPGGRATPMQLEKLVSRRYYDKYKAMAEEYNLIITNLDLFVKGSDPRLHLARLYRHFNDDPHLNTIPLHRFDNLYYAYKIYNPRSRITLGEYVCALKHMLVFQVLKAKPVFND